MPEDNVRKVSLSIEYDAVKVLGHAGNRKWMAANALTDYGESRFCLSIDMPTNQFKPMLGQMAESGCNQELIDYLKHARKVGAAWVVFENNNVN